MNKLTVPNYQRQHGSATCRGCGECLKVNTHLQTFAPLNEWLNILTFVYPLVRTYVLAMCVCV